MAENTVATQTQNTGGAVSREQTRDQERFITPPVDIFEQDEGLVVMADMPGLERENLEISVDQDVLTIKGVHVDRGEREFLHREFTPASFFRQFNLGGKIDQGRINAEYRHGVLKVRLPFAEETKPRSIEVKVG
jgi:HSP20 family protein